MHQHEYQHQQHQQQQQFKGDESIHYQRDTTVIFKRQFSPPHTVNPILTCRKKQRAPSQPQVTPVCQVEGCHRDLVDFKGYYRRHRVCELHSKTPKSIVDGIEQRFCQQCSRFHVLQEFDDGKRSCRKRLAGHNERRRKPPVSAESGLSLPGSLLSPGDFKPFIIQQQAVSAHRQHLLDGSFLCSWPEPAECSKASPAMTAALPVERPRHLQISDSQAISPQQRQEQMLYEFLKSHAARVPSNAAPLVSPLTIFNQGLASPAVPLCAATALGAVHGGALSLLSAGQSSSSPNLSVVSASGVHPRSSSPKTTTTATTGTRVLGSNSDMNNTNTSGYFSSTLPINTGLYKRPVGQLDSIMQIPQPSTTTSALDMLVYSRSEF